MTRAAAIVASIFLFLHTAVAAEPVSLQLPIDCQIGRDCFIQQYVDADRGAGAKDYQCGAQSYDGHKGTDFRIKTLRDARRGVDVTASADGTVKGVRNTVADKLLVTDADRRAVKGRECGNGVLLTHGDGWETQYCHLRRGSVRVAIGERVSAGDVLGQVGYSGEAAFPHVHLSVRKGGKVVDPFIGLTDKPNVCGPGDQPLWTTKTMDLLEYRTGQILDAGFAGHAPKLRELETGSVQGFAPKPDSPALVAWGWVINLQKGDQVVTVLKGPGGVIARSTKQLDANKAQYYAFAGKKRPGVRWLAGRYTALFAVLRDGKPVLRSGRAFVMP